jgi:hypothetical protein
LHAGWSTHVSMLCPHGCVHSSKQIAHLRRGVRFRGASHKYNE